MFERLKILNGFNFRVGGSTGALFLNDRLAIIEL
jgi:hypothetical protein